MSLLISDDGWLNVARRCPSPNYNPRPQTPISLVVDRKSTRLNSSH